MRHELFGNPDSVTREIGGQFRPGRDKIVTRKFGIMARALWPDKTAWHVAVICGCDERQAKRFIAGEYPVPYIMLRHLNDLAIGIAE